MGIRLSPDYERNLDSAYNTILSNTIYYNGEDGIHLDNVNFNTITGNEIFDNNWNGVDLRGTASNNNIEDNTIYYNFDQGVVVESNNWIDIRIRDEVTTTDAHTVHWQVSWVGTDGEDYGQMWDILNNFEVYLAVDDEPVEVWFSDVYWDDGWQAWRFDVDYWSDPLPVGEHDFTVELILFGDSFGFFTALVSVEPSTDENFTSHNTILNNAIFENRVGIRLFASQKNELTGNTISNNFDGGIQLEQSSESFILSNEVFGNGWGGIELMFSSNDNNVSWNTAYDNGMSGIFVMESSANVVVENTAYQNGFGGVSLSFAKNTQITGNMINNNYGFGIWLEFSNFNTIDANDVTNNGAPGIWIGESVANSVTNNEVSGSGGDSGINLYRSHEHYVAKNIVSGSYFGILLEHSHSNVIEKNTVYNNEDNGINLYQSGNNVVAKNLVFGNWNGIFAYDEPFYEEEFRLLDQILVTDSTHLVWEVSSILDDYDAIVDEKANLEAFLTVDGEPVEVIFSDIYFDSGEYWMWRYDINYFTEPLSVGEHFFTVEFEVYGEFIGPFTAIVTVVSQGIEVEKNIVVDNGRNGIITINKNDNDITKNVVSRNPWNGIALIRSDNSEVSKNFVFKAGDGIFLYQSNENYISKNTVSMSDFNGIAIWESNSNEITKNFVTSNALDGIQLYYSNNNVIKYNFVYKNDIGIHFINSYDNVLYRNRVFRNDTNFLEEEE
jgi:parallel beta-helix repeat protein